MLQISYFQSVNFTYLLWSPNIPKNHQKIYKAAQNSDLWDEQRDFWLGLKRDWDICVKAFISSQNTAFMLMPALISFLFLYDFLSSLMFFYFSKLTNCNLRSDENNSQYHYKAVYETKNT